MKLCCIYGQSEPAPPPPPPSSAQSTPSGPAAAAAALWIRLPTHLHFAQNMSCTVKYGGGGWGWEVASGVSGGLLAWFWAGSGLVPAQSSSSGVIKDVHPNAPRRWRRDRSGSTRASNEVLLDLLLGSSYISATESCFTQ